jgi:lactam utilization protein B
LWRWWWVDDDEEHASSSSRHSSSEAVQSAEGEAEGVAVDAVFVDADSAASVFAAPVLHDYIGEREILSSSEEVRCS